jgi:hypothetical protein
MDLEGRRNGLFKRIYQHLPEGTEENDNESKLRQVVPNWAFEIHKANVNSLGTNKTDKEQTH